MTVFIRFCSQQLFWEVSLLFPFLYNHVAKWNKKSNAWAACVSNQKFLVYIKSCYLSTSQLENTQCFDTSMTLAENKDWYVLCWRQKQNTNSFNVRIITQGKDTELDGLQIISPLPLSQFIQLTREVKTQRHVYQNETHLLLQFPIIISHKNNKMQTLQLIKC